LSHKRERPWQVKSDGKKEKRKRGTSFRAPKASEFYSPIPKRRISQRPHKKRKKKLTERRQAVREVERRGEGGKTAAPQKKKDPPSKKHRAGVQWIKAEKGKRGPPRAGGRIHKQSPGDDP